MKNFQLKILNIMADPLPFSMVFLIAKWYLSETLKERLQRGFRDKMTTLVSSSFFSSPHNFTSFVGFFFFFKWIKEIVLGLILL